MNDAHYTISKIEASFGLDGPSKLELPSLRWIRANSGEFLVEPREIQLALLPVVMIRLLRAAMRGFFLTGDAEWGIVLFLSAGVMFDRDLEGIGPYSEASDPVSTSTRLTKQ